MSLTQVIGSGLGSLGTSLVATADGGSATTSVIQGLTKHFTMYNQDANTVKESFNQSNSNVDNDTDQTVHGDLA